MIELTVWVDENSLVGKLERKRKNVEDSFRAGVKEAAEGVARYIKDHLLAGEMLQDRTGMLRSEETTSLPQGQLRKDVRIRSSGTNSKFRITVYVLERSKEISDILQEGRTGSWEIYPGGKKLKVPNEASGDFTFHDWVKHPGFGSFPFMAQGLEDRQEYVRNMITRFVKKGLKG